MARKKEEKQPDDESPRITTSSDSGDESNTDNSASQTMIVQGQVYRAKDGGREVIPFFVDRAAARVRFAPVGRSSEETMRTSEFADAFEHVGPRSSLAEEQKDVEEQRKENRELEEKRGGHTT